MKTIKIKEEWLAKLLPNGLPYPSSTLISGPGGSGKPLVGLAIVSDWLQSGGGIIFIPLQYPEIEFINISLNRLYNLKLEEFKNKVAYIKFNYNINSLKKLNENTIEANLLKPGLWTKAVNKANSLLITGKEPGTLVFASALNILLFSPTYRESILDQLEKVLKQDKNKTYLFTVSTSAFHEDIKKWESAADNLMFVQMQKPMQLYLKVTRLGNSQISSQEILVPMDREILMGIKKVAESVRKKDIPQLQKI